MSCRGSIPRAARFSVSSIPARRNWSMIFSGAPHAICRNGAIGIFNRSYYEEVLIARVHPEILRARDAGGMARKEGDLARPLSFHRQSGGASAPQRHPHRQILSAPFKGRTAQTFLARIEEPEKNWKFSTADVEERKFWKDYMKAYEACLGATSTGSALVHRSGRRQGECPVDCVPRHSTDAAAV